MNLNLDSLKDEILEYLEAQSFVVFEGFCRGSESRPVAFWDARRRPDFREFVATASRAGVKMMVFNYLEFASAMVESELEQLEDCEMPSDEHRALDRRLREMLPYHGFTCSLELSYDFDGRTYVYEVQAEWYGDFRGIMDEIDTYLPEGEDGEEDDSMGGYFSRN